MTFSDAQKKKILKFVKRALKTPGNQARGEVLDMVLVADCALLPEEQNEAALDIISFLRKEGGPFKNPRINLVKWKSDDRLDRSVISYPNLMIGLCLDKKDFTPDDTTMLWVEEADAADADVDESDDEADADSEETSEVALSEVPDTEYAEDAADAGEDEDSAVIDNKPAPIIPGPPKHMDSLIKELKKNYSKSKLILFLTSVEREFNDIESLSEYLDPILLKKIVTVFPDGSAVYPFELPTDEEDTDISENTTESEASPL